ncbi:MAG: cache domain-containing protein [Anaerolineae bacterium]
MSQQLAGVGRNLVRVLPDWSLRNRLLVFASAVLIPMVLFGSLAVRQNVAHTKRQILNSSLAIAKVIEANLVEKVDSTEHMLLTLAQSPVVRAQDARATRQLLIDVFPLQQNVLNLAAARQDGSVFATMVWDGLEPFSIAADLQFQQVLTTGQPAISGRLISTATDRRAVRLVVPYRDDKGQVIGALMVEISLSQLQRSLASIGTQEGATFIVADSEGMVLIHPNYKYVYEGANFADFPSVQAALRGEEGTVEHLNPLDRHPWLWAYTPVRRTGWAVVVGYPTAVAYPPVRDTLIRSLLSLLAMVILAGLVAFFLSHQLTKPLNELTQRALGIADGDLEQRASVHGSGELHQLARAFNVMSENLATHMSELAAAKEEISQKARRLRRLLVRTISLQEEERKRIAADIHDGISQLILGALYETEAAKEAIATNPALAQEKLAGAQELLEQTSTEMRQVIYDLRPPLLDDMGIVYALEQYLKSYREATGIQVSLTVSGPESRLPTETEMALYRIAQEALHNICKHAQTNRAAVLLSFSADRVRMAVQDQGVGFDPALVRDGAREHLGLTGMQERADSVGAHLQIQSTPGQGTAVVLEVAGQPVKEL